MDLLDRYLASIRHNLPPKRADDITEELRGELLDRVEAREEALGRPLNEVDTAAILKDYGPPLVVAGRYRENQYLIGPQAYPYYQYGLRVTIVIAVAVFFFSTLLPSLMANADPARAFFHGLHNVWTALFFSFTLVTLFFAVGERTGVVAKHIAAWNPAHLPTYEHQRKKGRWESPFEVGLGLLFLLFWSGLIPMDVGHTVNGIRIAPTPVWSAYYWPVLILSAARLVYNAIEWLRPNWKKAHFILGMATLIGGIAVISRFRADGPWAATTPVADVASQAGQVAASINTAIGIALLVAMIAWGFGLVMFVYQAYLRRFVMGR